MNSQLSTHNSSTHNSSTPSALTVRLGEITFPEGVETLGEKANWLHRCSVEFSKKSTGAAILAGWVLSVARSTCAHGQWLGWLDENVSFNIRTAQNYMSLYAQTLGAARAAARRPVALTVEPTADELEAAAHDVDGKALSALYKSTRLMSTSDNWGGANREGDLGGGDEGDREEDGGERRGAPRRAHDGGVLGRGPRALRGVKGSSSGV